MSYSGNPVGGRRDSIAFGRTNQREVRLPTGTPPAPASGGTLSRTRSHGPIEASACRPAETPHFEHRSLDRNRHLLHLEAQTYV